MTKFCIVAPPSILKGLESHGILGIKHLLLAHDVVVPSKVRDYDSLFGDREWDKKSELVILDNSVIETGKAVDLDMIADAIKIVRPTCVVLPDVLLDSEATIDSCCKALDAWPAKLGEDTNYMYVPQGKDICEFIEAATISTLLMLDPRITHWGVPRNLVKSLDSHSRAFAIRLLHELNPNRSIHMLGFSDNMVDDFQCASMPEVDSIDSAVPLRINVPMDIKVVPEPRGDWWDKAQLTQLTIHNLQQTRLWLHLVRFP